MRRITKRFDFAPLERYIVRNYHDPHKRRAAQVGENELTTTRIGEIVGRDAQNIHLYRRHGISEAQADRLCVKLNIHPSYIWPDWWGPEASEADDVELALG